MLPPKQTILIVDDEVELVDSLKTALEEQGFSALVAFDGAEALKLAQTKAPNLILLDLMMPKLDGYQVCRLLKFDERYRKIAILVLTARTQPQDLNLATKCGADSYLIKPVQPALLLQRIRDLLS